MKLATHERHIVRRGNSKCDARSMLLVLRRGSVVDTFTVPYLVHPSLGRLQGIGRNILLLQYMAMCCNISLLQSFNLLQFVLPNLNILQ
jgi:hypothetical protein